MGWNSIKISFIHTESFHDIPTTYMLKINGVNKWFKKKETVDITRYFTHSRFGEAVHLMDNIKPGYRYTLDVCT